MAFPLLAQRCGFIRVLTTTVKFGLTVKSTWLSESQDVVLRLVSMRRSALLSRKARNRVRNM